VGKYTVRLLSIGMLYLLFKDAIKEGDGKRTLSYYRYLLPIFINSNRVNYSNEAFKLLCQYHHDLPPLQAEQLMWCCFVNTSGVRRCNIPLDLHLEHLNKDIKNVIQGLGANITNEALIRCGKALSTISETLMHYDNNNNVTVNWDVKRN